MDDDRWLTGTMAARWRQRSPLRRGVQPRTREVGPWRLRRPDACRRGRGGPQRSPPRPSAWAPWVWCPQLRRGRIRPAPEAAGALFRSERRREAARVARQGVPLEGQDPVGPGAVARRAGVHGPARTPTSRSTTRVGSRTGARRLEPGTPSPAWTLRPGPRSLRPCGSPAPSRRPHLQSTLEHSLSRRRTR